MSRVLVTGASGFTGGHLARRLQALGHQVRVLLRSPAAGKDAHAAGFEVVTGDLRDAQAVDQAVAGCELVFHVAALFRTERVPDHLFFEVNREGTRHVFESAQRHGVRRVVHISTGGVHGHIAQPPANEDYPYGPRDPYQQSKLEGELLARSYFEKGVGGSVVRPIGVYGPGDTRFLKLFRAIHKGWFVMLGRGQTLYHLTYIDDLIEGILRCGEHPAAEGEVFIIGGERFVSLQEFVRTIAAALQVPAPRWHLPLWPFRLAAPICQSVCRTIGIEPPLYPRRLEFFTDDRAFDITKARRVLGYVPQVSLEDGLRRTVTWYQHQGLLS